MSKKNQTAVESDWMRLDNAATIYPASRRRNWMALFRLSMELTQRIEPQTLDIALNNTLKRFPGFAVRLKNGFFWHYFERLDGAPKLQQDVRNPCVRMNFHENDGFMFRVRYHENRIALELFHVLTDGTGGLCFLKTLVAEYLRLKYELKITYDEQTLSCASKPTAEELEDCFLRYARNGSMSRGESTAYNVDGRHEPDHDIHVTTGTLDSLAVRDKARQYGASVGEYLTAVLIAAVHARQVSEPSRRKRFMPVKICVPVNLRKFYNAKTLRNFSSYVNPGIEPRYGEYTMQETVDAVRHYMGLEATEKRLNAKFATNVASVQNHFLRATPLFLKNRTLKLVFILTGDRQTSSSISNLGNTTLPEEMRPYVSRIDFMLGPLSYNPVVAACVSYEGKMQINFTRTIKETDIERSFFTLLVKDGLHVLIESNNDYSDGARSSLEA